MNPCNQHLIKLSSSKPFSINFEQMEHSETTTCDQSAAARGEDIAIGGKTLLFKSKKAFHLFVTSAATEVDSTKVRKNTAKSKNLLR